MIKIYPVHHLNRYTPKFVASEGFTLREFHPHKYVQYTNSAKSAINAICRKHHLSRQDEVLILTTTDKPYVSTCVSATIFNYAKISRVLSAQTRMIYVIHEFGIVHREIDKIRTLANQRKIPLIEDCAHSPMSHFLSRPSGSWGDYSIYSLSKHLPIASGGAVISKDLINLNQNEVPDPSLVVEIEKWIKFLPDICNRRRKIFEKISSIFPQEIHEPIAIDGSIPYFFIMKNKEWERITHEVDNRLIELGRTYNSNWICIPTQPFASDMQWDDFTTKFKEHL
jgi:hypothetical protein